MGKGGGSGLPETRVNDCPVLLDFRKRVVYSSLYFAYKYREFNSK